MYYIKETLKVYINAENDIISLKKVKVKIGSDIFYVCFKNKEYIWILKQRVECLIYNKVKIL